MKIVIKKNSAVAFKELEVGDVFTLKSGMVYIKTTTLQYRASGTGGFNTMNAFRLSDDDNQISLFNDDMIVFPKPNAVLLVDGEN